MSAFTRVFGALARYGEVFSRIGIVQTIATNSLL
jgi:hypothetical protein